MFRACDLTENKEVAIKILRPGAGAEAQLEFQTEGQLLERLRHRSHVLNLLGSPSNTDTITITKPGLPSPIPLPVEFIVIDLADACLADLVVNRSHVSWSARLSLFRDVVLGVHQMHLGTIVHRDIKSENALVTLDGGSTAHACIADLGRGRDLHDPPRFLSDAYLAGRGDLRFAPPELLHLAGSEDPAVFRRADVFLLGSALFELATGQGITSMVFTNPHAVLTGAMAIAPDQRLKDYKARVSEHRARFEPVFLLAQSEFPSSIRHDATRLLRQLCDADPELREARFRADSRNPIWGLHWLLRRVDVLIRREQIEVRRTRKAP